ncbi:MAG: SigB/SigF/SigG family RNA polymerase sigma factor [Acetatifactor sp.]|nr:SigB/SigF/SigG family RNA polymerase sigma factor [Acetatifactor sp.]
MEDISVLIQKSQDGDKKAREILIENNLGLVHHIVKRFLGRGHDIEDLFQIGVIGLMKSIDHFDLKQQVKFSTYAVPMITGEIRRFLRDDGPVKVSRSIKENGWKVNAARKRLLTELKREPTLEEISGACELRREDVIVAMEASCEVESLYNAVTQSDGSELFLVDRVVMGEQGIGSSFEGATAGKENYTEEKVINHLLLEQLLNRLEERERFLIQMRYFQNKTQGEVARVMGISQVQVSRLEKKILQRLREQVL